MSLAEELQAVFAAETTPKSGTDLRQSLVLPLGVHLDGDHGGPSTCRGETGCGTGVGLSQFLINISELGTPEQIDPVNKYRDVVCDMAYGCIYSTTGDFADANQDADNKSTDDIPLPSTVSRSSSSLSGSALEDCVAVETTDVTSARLTHVPSSMTNSLEQPLDDVEDLVKAPVTSRVVECLPDVIATTVGVSRNDRDPHEMHRGNGADEFTCADLYSRTSSRGSKKSSLYGGHLDRTSSLESSRKCIGYLRNNSQKMLLNIPTYVGICTFQIHSQRSTNVNFVNKNELNTAFN
jgi:hypothetical protein